MIKVDWNKFKIKNENCRDSFEQLCYFLFCRKYEQIDGVFRHKNQTGIETEPILKNKKWYGFQSKWFESKIDAKQIIDSIEKAKTKNSELNIIILYINQEFAESSKKDTKESSIKKSIEDKAKELDIKIDWVVPSNFEVILNQPNNFDLAQFYFDDSDELGFTKSCLDPYIRNFLNSNEYIDVPFSKNGTSKGYLVG